MGTRKYFYTFTIGLVTLLLLVGCSSSGGDDSKKSSTSSSTLKTLPPLSTASTTKPVESLVLGGFPFLSSSQISVQWTENNLCGLISRRQAASILDMTTNPNGVYKFSDVAGARCTFRSGSGEEIYIEIATTKYKDARAIDRALNLEIKEISVKGVAGISKKMDDTSINYELNIGGELSNQWVASAPDSKSAKKLAETLIESFKN